MNPEDFFTTPEFRKLHPVKQQVIKELALNGESTTPESMLPRIMTVNKELSKRKLNFTKEETALLIRIMKQGMTPEEQQKVDMLMGFFR
ncbi:MAG: hypothetical protein IJP29_00670 [Lachnospiraceae bacterium]|nr:hypothetical protein [Lachnospiraceae bacterium]